MGQVHAEVTLENTDTDRCVLEAEVRRATVDGVVDAATVTPSSGSGAATSAAQGD